ncbi:hypothetical protein DPMN_166194 [Dreissena polymorpha]|uniref:Uncharacterized protein n=1 Tax=Dreissena polymorpha TaxID=45954 RepID=A0A9D4EWE2_DREPO|nr:hypothetical protein DPMN_166194 [Dreissena polymorpha]
MRSTCGTLGQKDPFIVSYNTFLGFTRLLEGIESALGLLLVSLVISVSMLLNNSSIHSSLASFIYFLTSLIAFGYSVMESWLVYFSCHRFLLLSQR